MKTSRLDLATDMLEGKLNNIRRYLDKETKGEKPLFMVKMSDEEAISKYLAYPPEIIEFNRQNMPEVWGAYEKRIKEAMLRRQKNG